MIELYITRTSKSYSPKDTWHTFDNERKSFADKSAAMQWIADTYGRAKRNPMYRDLADGTSIRAGYIIGFRNSERSPTLSTVEHWLQQDWISFYECEPLTFD